MAENFKLNWYAQQAIAAVGNLEEESLDRLAFQAEGYAKSDPRTPVDTGFMRNAIYAISAKRSNRQRALMEARAAARRDIASAPHLPRRSSAVHAAAEYTIYQEMRHHFLYRALEKVAALAGGILVQAGQKWLS